MTIAHMAMVFAAEGLDGSEKLLLLAYTNRCDDHGYCWPGQKRLIDDCGTSAATVKRAKKSLIAKNLIRSVRRKDPQTGDPITNLTRVNIGLLQSMARKTTVYDDNVIEQLTFAPAEEPMAPAPAPARRTTKREKKSGPNPPGQLRAQDEPDPDLLKDQTEPKEGSSRSHPPVTMSPPQGQREPQNLTQPTTNSHLSPLPSPTPGAAPCDAHRVTEAWQTARHRHGHGTPALAPARIQRDAAALLDQGHAIDHLMAAATDMATQPTWLSLPRHLERFVAPAPDQTTRRPLPPWCGTCNNGLAPTAPGQRMRENSDGRLTKCTCHPGYTTPPTPSVPPETPAPDPDLPAVRRAPIPRPRRSVPAPHPAEDQKP